MSDKKADLAGPGIGTYEDVEAGLPKDYKPLLNPKDTQKAIALVKRTIEDGLCRELNLIRVECPLILERDCGMNDYLDRDGSRTPVDFQCGLGLPAKIDAQVVQAATKWKRWALKQFGLELGEGLYTDMRAVRKDYFLDHDHSSYVDQWDWERVMKFEDRNLDFLKEIVGKIWKVLIEARKAAVAEFPALSGRYAEPPDELVFLHAEEILAMYPDLPRKQRETAIIQKYPAIFIIGIGHTLEDGYPHEMRAADYDDWTTPTIVKDGKQMHGLNGDILVWNDVTHRRHELTSMGIRVTKETLVEQLKITGQEHFLEMPYHKMIMNDEIPLSVGGGLGQSRIYGWLLNKAALGECSVTVWPQQLHDICEKHNIHLLR
ncbi:aspartate--ammonia ligase [bacterium]|nr:aspartate--ammonia ligase [bacterium]